MFVGTWRTTSLVPCSSTATTSPVPQFATHRRPSCQRGDSPIARPVSSVRGSGIVLQHPVQGLSEFGRVSGDVVVATKEDRPRAEALGQRLTGPAGELAVGRC